VPAFWDDCDPTVTSACQHALNASGWTVREREVEHLELARAAAMARLMAEVPRPSADVLKTLSSVTRAFVLAALLVPAGAVPKADRLRAAVIRALRAAFDDVDLLVSPSTPAAAPPLDDPWITLPSGRVPADVASNRHMVLANLCGIPGVSVPVGLTPDALPIGLQLLAPWGCEERVLDAAEHLEAALS
jgi:Asp-tRNA(Asn)/Glu-tRNA(Gln) amidotransferase A subunit family amidase